MISKNSKSLPKQKPGLIIDPNKMDQKFTQHNSKTPRAKTPSSINQISR